MQSSRAVLLLVLLVLAAAIIAFFALKAPSGPPASPEQAPEGEGVGTTPHLPAGRPGAIAGVVRVFKTGEPAADVAVRIEGGEKPIGAATGEDGGFRSQVPSGVELTVTVDAPEPYAAIVIRGVVVEPGKTEDLGTLNLERAFLVKGRVIDQAGEPVPGATVGALRGGRVVKNLNIVDLVVGLARRRAPVEEAKTGADGAFVLRTLSPGTYRFQAAAEGYATAFKPNIVVSPDSESRPLTIVLTPGTSLVGTVKNTEGTPVSDATVTAISQDQRAFMNMEFHPVQAVTDEGGSFRFGSLTPGRAVLMILANGYPQGIQDNVDVGKQNRVDIVLGGACVIQGKVADERGEPIEGAHVTLAVGQRGGAFGRAETGADGKYLMAHLPAGRIQFMTVRKEGYPSWPAQSEMMRTMRGFGELAEGKPLVKDFVLADGAVVKGRVLDGSSGRPVAGAEVSVGGFGFFGVGGGASSVTDEDGAYRLEGVGVGTHLLLVKAPRYFQKGLDPQSMQRAMMPAGMGGPGGVDPDAPMVKVESKNQDVVKDLTVLPGASLSGTVLAPDGTPVAGARVTCVAGGEEFGMLARFLDLAPGSELTNAEGEFRIQGVAAGESVKLRASADGYVDGESSKFAIETGAEMTGLTVTLKAGGTLAGTVLGADGAGIPRATVRILPEQEGVERTWQNYRWRIRQAETHVTGDDGTFRVSGLEAGLVVVGVEAPGHQPAYRFGISIPEGGVTDGQTFTLEKGLVISGVVRDDRGAPIAGVRLRANPKSPGIGENATSDEDGSFSFDRLRPGSYDLSANADGYASESRKDVAAGTEDLEIVLSRGKAIEGRVNWPDGRPAKGVWVSASSERSNQSAQTGEDGTFRIDDLPPGAYTVTARPQNRFFGAGSEEDAPNAREASIEGVQAGTTGVIIDLAPGFSISGVVVDESGAPVPSANVMARPAGQDGGTRSGSTQWAQTDANGAFVIRGLDDGLYQVNGWGAGLMTADAPKVKGGTDGIQVVMKKRPNEGLGPTRPR